MYVSINFALRFLLADEVKSAERVFESALQFVSAQSTVRTSEHWSPEDVQLARQIALFNMASLHLHTQQWALAEHYLVLSLTQCAYMSLGTTTQVVQALSSILLQREDSALHARLVAILRAHQLSPLSSDKQLTSAGSANAPKRLAFALDYSGSMAGSKIKAAVDNLQDLFANHVGAQDEILIIKFNGRCEVVLPLTGKQGNEERIGSIIRTLVAPNGGTALYDGTRDAIRALSASAGAGQQKNDWAVVLTDGQEGNSSTKKAEIEQLLRTAICGVIIIGVGIDVNVAELEGLTHCAKKGFFVPAEGSRAGIEQAFGRVAVLMRGQVIMEDI
jgi:uncharacterized protein YegL